MNIQIGIQKQRGFSLIEMLMVIAIVMIMSAIALPFFGGFLDNRNLKNAARDIAGDIFELKERAISEDSQYQIQFNQGANNYALTGGASAMNVTKSSSAFGSGIFISALSQPTFILQARGIVSNGSITLQNNRGSTATINISLSGRTSVTWILQ